MISPKCQLKEASRQTADKKNQNYSQIVLQLEQFVGVPGPGPQEVGDVEGGGSHIAGHHRRRSIDLPGIEPAKGVLEGHRDDDRHGQPKEHSLGPHMH